MSKDQDGDRIRQAFERSLEPPSDGFVARMRSAVIAPRAAARTARRWPLEVAAAVLAMVAIAALTLPHLMVRPVNVEPTPSPPASVVPWAEFPATNVAQPFTKPGVQACSASQLVFDIHVADPSYVGAGPVNTSFWVVSVTNKSRTPCFVGPTLDVAFATAQGPIQLTAQRGGGDIVYLSPVTGPIVGYTDRAIGEIDAGPCALPRITKMTISPGPGLGAVQLDPGPAGGSGSPCPEKPETYSVELTTDANQGGYVASTETAMQAPTVGRPGDHLRFLITISNRQLSHSELAGTVEPTPAPLVFSPCPTYHLELEGVEGTFHTYYLNCAESATIPANQSETFEMFIDVPRSAQPGPAVLVWSIDGSPQRWQRTSAYIAIES